RLREQTAEVEQLQTSLRDEQSTRHTLEDSLRQLREGADRFLQDNTTDIEHATTVLQKELPERKRAEETLIHTLQEYKQLTEALPDAFFVIDQQGKIRKWNKMIEQAPGYPRGELLGLPAIQLFAEEEHDRITAILFDENTDSQRSLETVLLGK